MSTEFPAGLAVYLAGRIHAARRRYRKRLERCREKFSEHAVHDLRVEMRRGLALLDLLATLRLGGSLRKPARNLKKRLDALDELRDTHVQLRLLKPIGRRFPEARQVRRWLHCREDRLVSRLAHKINSLKPARLNQRLKQVEKCLGHESGRKNRAGLQAAATALRETFRRVAGLRRAVRRDEPATIHRLRVAFKRFRYMSELLEPLLPGLTARQLERMRRYQAAAGDIQDIEVLLAGLADAVRGGELDADDVKHLQEELLRRRNRAIDLFMARIDDLFEFRKSADARS